jgi:hypothetical protein
MKQVIKWIKHMHQSPLEVFEHFSDSHHNDRMAFRNFEISIWEHIKNLFIYFMYHNINLIMILITLITKKEKILALQGFKVSIKLTYIDLYQDLKALYQYVYVNVRRYLSI